MTLHIDLGSLSKLEEIICSYKVQRVLVVSGRSSFEKCGAKGFLKKSLKNFLVSYFSDFEVNPSLLDANRGVAVAIENKIELIVSVGGGSVLDMGKLIKAFYATPGESESLAKGERELIDPGIPLIAIPTTAGSGSESTHFAVVYIGDEKHSLASDALLPNDVILDGNLVLSATQYQKACNVLDAISQSIESAWAVASTRESRILSYKALELCVSNFTEYVYSRDNQTIAQNMIKASNFAGQAINIAKTTAAHAWSYSLTKKYGIPHGHAVWATLPKIFEIHSTSHSGSIRDPRGSMHLEKVMEILMNILRKSANEDFSCYFRRMLDAVNIKADIAVDLQISYKGRLALSRDVNQERMRNNPVIFNQSCINKIFNLF